MKSEARQEQILDCAKRVFATRGYHAANISHICAEAGIGRGTLYQYFRNKKAVFTAILRETLERVRTLMVGRRLESWPKPENIRRDAAIAWCAERLEHLFDAVFQDEQTLRIILREAVGLDVDIEHMLSEIDESLISIVAADLRAAQKVGIADDFDARLIATLIVGGVEKLAITALRSEFPVSLTSMAQHTARLHCVGIMSTKVGRA